MELLYNAIIGHMIEILFLILSIVGLYLISYVKSRLTGNQQVLIENIIRTVVLYVQQHQHFQKPEHKLELAVSQAIAIMNEKGISIDEGEIYVQIEARLKELKKEFGDNWKN